MNLPWISRRLKRAREGSAERDHSLTPVTGGVVIAGLFLLVGLFTRAHYGPTVDERESMRGARVYAGIVASFLAGEPRADWPFHEIPGYYFLTDLVRHAIARSTSALFFAGQYRAGFHVANLSFSALSVFLLYRLCARLTQNQRIAALSAMALALTPQFVANSQNNPKDLVALFAFAMGVSALVEVHLSPRPRWLILGAGALGWSFTTSPLSVLLIPLGFFWLVLFERSRLVLHGRSYVALLAGGAAAAVLLWPWLWTDPVSNALYVATRLSHFDFNIREVYWNRIWDVNELPWHYVPVHLAASLPLVYFLGGLMNVSRWRKREGDPKGETSLLGLGVLWLGVGLVASFGPSLKYNGMRHFLFVLPSVAILVGSGLDRFFVWLKPVQAGAVVAALFILQAWFLVRLHPYEEAYVNSAVNALIPDHAERYLSLEYFGHAYLEGGRWLNRNQEPGSRNFAPIFGFVADSTLKRKSTVGSLEEFLDPAHVSYLMYITRASRYTPLIEYVEANFQPVYEIRRGKATLLRIFSNQGPRSRGCH